jgi:hypothetical protein
MGVIFSLVNNPQEDPEAKYSKGLIGIASITGISGIYSQDIIK